MKMIKIEECTDVGEVMCKYNNVQVRIMQKYINTKGVNMVKVCLITPNCNDFVYKLK